MSAPFFLYNGKWMESDQPLIMADNRAFRYGEGIFETMRSRQGKVPLFDYHWNRLIADLPFLYFELSVHFTPDYLKEQILKLCRKNRQEEAARIRLTFFKGEGGIWEPPTTSFNWILQSWKLPAEKPVLNSNGIELGIYKEAHKSCDRLSNIKSNHYLIYVLAAQYAKIRHWNEAIVLNQFGRICDTTIANLFFIKDGVIHTPALTEGCVNGVMRRYLLEQFAQREIPFEEGAYEVETLLDADEIFLTNAVQGIRWVKSLGNQSYAHSQTMKLFLEYIQECI